ncbi:MAG: transposase, partial [Pseudomonas sp.]|nr:transposase [Pseudomonas sp.]
MSYTQGDSACSAVTRSGQKSRFTDSQILSVLKQAENGILVPELCRKHGMSNATFYKWRAKF